MTTRTLAIGLVVATALVMAVSPVRTTLGQGFALLATGQLGQFRQYLQSLGPWAPLVSIAMIVAEAVAVPIPVAVIMVANGLAFGLWLGMLVSLAGGVIGALTAYWVGRLVGRTILERVLPSGSLRVADRLMAKYGRWAVVLERWIPGVPGDPVSYVAGLTRLPLWTFFSLTIVGLVPANLATAYLGSQVAGDVPRQYWIAGVVLVGAVLAAWWAARRRPWRHTHTPSQQRT